MKKKCNDTSNDTSSYVGNEIPDYYGDDNLLPYIRYKKEDLSLCCYCGNVADSREHLPSKTFLDKPYPEELFILPSCTQCNRSFSNDEEYLACLIEWVYSKFNNGELRRDKIKNTFKQRPFWVELFSRGTKVDDNGNTIINFDAEKIKKILIKLARGHVVYMLSELMYDEPDHISFIFYPEMPDDKFDEFNSIHKMNVLPEIGCRAFRQVVTDDFGILYSIWDIIQEGRYRYIVFVDSMITVRIVIGEYLFAEIIWDN